MDRNQIVTSARTKGSEINLSNGSYIRLKNRVGRITSLLNLLQTFLGQKYGYRPFPAKISAPEFESLLEAVDNRDDHQLLTEWFCKDDNAVPSQYLLQPITSRLPQYRDPENEEARKKASADWWTTFERMQIVLRTAADKVFDEDERLKYHMSGSVYLSTLSKV